ncbi:MAG TPA: ABC transporter substrate-binding protein [Actinomycetota bacterium]|nr:ABC transporter substrate-binding protein [Actinomycetota bacterium]
MTSVLSGRSRLIVAGVVALLVVAGAIAWAATRGNPFIVGAVYPTNGGQGPGGVEEYRGVQLAAALANSQGGVHGQQIDLRLKETDSADAAPGSVDSLMAGGAKVVVGSYGSTIAYPAAVQTYDKGGVFWETGAVGDLGEMSTETAAPYLGTRVFRFPPAGTVLGSAAIDFINSELRTQLPARPLTYSVAYVNDDYGSEVGQGALDEIHKLGLLLGATLPYDLNTANYAQMAASIAQAHTDVLFVSSYLNDAESLRQQILAQHVPLLVNIGTSSSYCLPQFGAALGSEAVGLFASDKPDADVLKTSNLTPAAAQALSWAKSQYAQRWGGSMSAAALTGFAGAWALFHDVLPAARAMTPAGIAAAAQAMNLPMGALPNGSGLQFGTRGTASAGENVRALSVIWEWTAPNTRAVVYPPAYATAPIHLLPVSSAA